MCGAMQNVVTNGIVMIHYKKETGKRLRSILEKMKNGRRNMMKEIWNKILYTPIKIWKVFTFLLACMALCIFGLVRLS
jgi:hypothetical protein